MRQRTVSQYYKERFGDKVYRVAIDAGFTCPNRDGSKGVGGCIFCSERGSGDFTDAALSISEQLAEGKKRVAGKCRSGKYIAYFQAFTNTYAPVEVLRERYMEAIDDPEVVGLSIATRPDCLAEDVLDLLCEMNEKKPVWVELGLQTIHEKTAVFIHRGYKLGEFDRAVEELKKRCLPVIVHMIIGLPGESVTDMVETCRYIGESLSSAHREDSEPDGIKLQLLHILKGTELARIYEQNQCCESGGDRESERKQYSVMKQDWCLEAKEELHILTQDEYIEILKQCLSVLPEDIVIHRLTGDGNRRDLIAPLWSLDKKKVWNQIDREVIQSGVMAENKRM